MARLAAAARAHARHGIGDARASRARTRLLARGAQRVNGQMGARPRHIELVPTVQQPAVCTSPGCRLPAWHGGLCGHCAAVYAAAEQLYHQLAAREMARLELDQPGLEHAARMALRAGKRRTPARAATATRQDPAIARSALEAPLTEWQIARLEQFVGQLRAPATTEAGGAA